MECKNKKQKQKLKGHCLGKTIEHMDSINLVCSVILQSNLSSPLPWETSSSSTVTSSAELHSREGVPVWEKSTGRVIAGVAAPSEEELVPWLLRHPSFSVLKPTGNALAKQAITCR